MDEPNGDADAGVAPPGGVRAAVFVAMLAAYYLVYYIFFALRLQQYFRDLMSHFGFFRRLF